MTRRRSNSNKTNQAPAPETKSQPAVKDRESSLSENVVQHVPLDAIRMDLLNRDLVVEDNEDLSDLMTSLKDVGLLNPIRVIADDNDADRI